MVLEVEVDDVSRDEEQKAGTFQVFGITYAMPQTVISLMQV